LPEDAEDEPLPAPFPVDALPSAMAGIIAAISRCERVPLALPGVCALGVVSAAIGAGLEVVSGPNRTTRANLFLLASAESGSGKTESCRPIIAPLIERQATLLQTWKEKTHPEYQAEIARLEAQRKAIEKKIGKAMRPDNPDEEELRRLQAQLSYPSARIEELKQRTAPCLITDDFTVEALALRLRDNRETLFSFSSDARKPVQNLQGRYNPGKSTDESLLLKTYSGEFCRVDRAKGDPIVLWKPCLSLCWFIQPDLMAAMLDEESLTASGFLCRLLMCHTQATPQKIEVDAPGISDAVRAQWAKLTDDLLATFHAADKPRRIEPTPEAKCLLDDFHNAIVDHRQGDLADVGTFAARYAEQAWRVSAVLHAALHGSAAANHPLERETAQNAIRVVEWFIAQQLDILAKGRRQSAQKKEDEVLELLNRRKERAGKDYITARDVHHARIASTPEAARALLARMEADGLLIGEDVKPERGGRATRIYRSPDRGNPVPP
jgi:hypothetical protein